MVAATSPKSDVWWIFLLEGIAAIIFGILLLTQPAATLVALVIFLGFYWLFVGVLELVRVFVDRSVPWFWSLLIGILGIVAGIIVLRHPLFAAIVLPTAIVVWLGVLGLVIGVFAIIGGFTGGGIGSFIFGVINFIIGLILLGSPMVAALAVPLVFGILLIVEGIALLFWAFKVKP
ncbi:MAG: HdeD family acid-resistance protein [Hyphomicrobiales bacterium]